MIGGQGAQIVAFAPWIEIVIVVFFLLGAGLALIAALGMLLLKNFFARLHMPTLVMTGALYLVIFAYMVAFLALHHKISGQALFLLLFVFIISPIQTMMIARGSLYREVFFFLRKQSRQTILKGIRNFKKNSAKTNEEIPKPAVAAQEPTQNDLS